MPRPRGRKAGVAGGQDQQQDLVKREEAEEGGEESQAPIAETAQEDHGPGERCEVRK